MSVRSISGVRNGPSRGWAVLGQVVAIIAALVVTAALRGLVFAVLWGWFVQPLGVRAINIAEAIGLTTIVGLLTLRGDDEDKKRVPFGERLLAASMVSVSGAGMALLVGWIAHLLVAT